MYANIRAHPSTDKTRDFYSVSYSQVITHPSTNKTQYFYSVSYSHVIAHSCTDETQYFYSILYSQVITHPSTDKMQAFYSILYYQLAIVQVLIRPRLSIASHIPKWSPIQILTRICHTYRVRFKPATVIESDSNPCFCHPQATMLTIKPYKLCYWFTKC